MLVSTFATKRPAAADEAAKLRKEIADLAHQRCTQLIRAATVRERFPRAI